ncbi:hypothetical protein STXM2123_906 [Streptomyces sp. F-3]|nr:hypothetical protein STXM2123_906 [Streptomyces sp. F-3]
MTLGNGVRRCRRRFGADAADGSSGNSDGDSDGRTEETEASYRQYRPCGGEGHL